MQSKIKCKAATELILAGEHDSLLGFPCLPAVDLVDCMVEVLVPYLQPLLPRHYIHQGCLRECLEHPLQKHLQESQVQLLHCGQVMSNGKGDLLSFRVRLLSVSAGDVGLF